MGAADRLGRGRRETQEAHLALPHERGHRADRVLDRRLGVDTVLEVEIDHLHPKSPQTRLARLADISGRPFTPRKLASSPLARVGNAGVLGLGSTA